MLVPLVALCLLSAGQAAPARGQERPLAVDLAQSHVEIAVKATVDSFVAKLAQYEPSIRIGEGGRITAARFVFHFRDIATGKEGRDKAMHKWQQTDTYPDGEFVLSSIEPAADGSSTAFGRLTLHGVTRDLRFPVSIARHGETYAIDGDATVDTREFGLPIIRMMALLKVDPLVRVRFHLQGSATALEGGAP